MRAASSCCWSADAAATSVRDPAPSEMPESTISTALRSHAQPVRDHLGRPVSGSQDSLMGSRRKHQLVRQTANIAVGYQLLSLPGYVADVSAVLESTAVATATSCSMVSGGAACTPDAVSVVMSPDVLMRKT